MQIRPVRPDDAAALAAIYSHHILHGTGTFEEEPITPAQMAERVAAITGRGWPWLVADEGGTVAGYAYAGIFRDRSAYRFSCEDSIYLHPDHLGRGLGRTLLDAILAASRAAGFERMVAVIGDSANLASIRVHAAAGFRPAGQLDRAGFKFGRYLDVVFMQREL
jgi:phosphinothricin acetyltransferase